MIRLSWGRSTIVTDIFESSDDVPDGVRVLRGRIRDYRKIRTTEAFFLGDCAQPPQPPSFFSTRIFSSSTYAGTPFRPYGGYASMRLPVTMGPSRRRRRRWRRLLATA